MVSLIAKPAENHVGFDEEEAWFRWTRLHLEGSGSSEGLRRIPVSVLVVEDESLLALFLEQKLRGFGFETVGYVTTGEGAIARALEARPNLLLVDINLRGGMDGITAVSSILQHLDVPVVYLSAYVDPETVQRAQATRPFAFLEKPVDDDTLWKTIQAACEEHRQRDEGSEGDDS